MYKVGLTGNYYSGQVEVSEILKGFDVPVFDANLVTKFLLNFSPNHVRKIKSEFGDDIYNLGLLNFNKLNSNDKVDKLFDIIELDILKSYELFRIKHKNDFYTIFYFDFIFERRMNNLMNFNVSCYRPRYQRKYDMGYLTSFSKSLIEKILSNEMDESVKNSNSDFVINNYNKNGDHKSDVVVGLESQVFNLHKKIMAKKMDSVLKSHYPSDIDKIEWD
jgi:dephospho-CoA kinase